MGLKVLARGGVWWVSGTLMGERVRRSTELPAEPAWRDAAETKRMAWEKAIIEARHGIGGVGGPGVAAEPTVRETWRAYEASEMARAERLGGDAGRHLRGQMARVGRVVARLGDRRVGDVTTAEWRAAIDGEGSNWANGTKSRVKSMISAAVGRMRSDGRVTRPVVLPSWRVRDARTEHWDEDEVIAFLDAVGREEPHYWLAFAVLIYTGVRVNELMRLRRINFKLRGGEASVRVVRDAVRGGKTISREVPVGAWLVEAAAGAAEVEGRMFYGKEGVWRSDQPATVALGRTMRRVCERNGLRAVRVHDLRHTFAYLMASAGCDLGDLQGLMGHESVAMTMRYRGFVKSRARAAALAVRAPGAVSACQGEAEG